MAELAPASETAGPDKWGSETTYFQKFSGSSFANGTTLVASGVDDVVECYGWIKNSAGNKFPFPYTSDTDTATVYRNSSGALLTFGSGGWLSREYEISVLYTKS